MLAVLSPQNAVQEMQQVLPLRLGLGRSLSSGSGGVLAACRGFGGATWVAKCHWWNCSGLSGHCCRDAKCSLLRVKPG